MELVARDMKALGIYTARSLSYAGVAYDAVLHEVTDPQRELYDTLARAWQTVLQNIEEAIEVNNTSKNAKAAALSSFWSSHQRFFNLIILTIQFPSVARDIQKHLDEGDAIIIQLTSTNEAQTKRALAQEKGKQLNEEISLEALDISPKSILIEYLNNSFPVTQYEDYEDENGNIKQRVVSDSEGNPVINYDSVQKRDQLISQIEEELVIPQGPLDSILQTFGADN
ncbi:Protein strawberry notch homolog 1, partial [Durusdinium trenchii]